MSEELNKDIVVKLNNNGGVIALKSIMRGRKTYLINQSLYLTNSRGMPENRKFEIEEEIISSFKQEVEGNATMHIMWESIGRHTFFTVTIEPTSNILQGDEIIIKDVLFSNY